MQERTTTARIDASGKIYVPQRIRRMLDLVDTKEDVEITIRTFDQDE